MSAEEKWKKRMEEHEKFEKENPELFKHSMTSKGFSNCSIYLDGEKLDETKYSHLQPYGLADEFIEATQLRIGGRGTVEVICKNNKEKVVDYPRKPFLSWRLGEWIHNPNFQIYYE